MKLQLDANGWSILPTYLNNIYVSSSTGKDTNPGTQAAPLQTLNAAYNRLKNDTGIFLMRGVRRWVAWTVLCA
jgi:hypothetical protein